LLWPWPPKGIVEFVLRGLGISSATKGDDAMTDKIKCPFNHAAGGGTTNKELRAGQPALFIF
jgi:hypothetical protein